MTEILIEKYVKNEWKMHDWLQHCEGWKKREKCTKSKRAVEDWKKPEMCPEPDTNMQLTRVLISHFTPWHPGTPGFYIYTNPNPNPKP
jgi:hypothetical protein